MIDGLLICGENEEVISSRRRFDETRDISDEAMVWGSEDLVLESVLTGPMDPTEFVLRVNQLHTNRKVRDRDEIPSTGGTL